MCGSSWRWSSAPLAGCSNKNNTGMADEATTASQSASDGANGSMGRGDCRKRNGKQWFHGNGGAGNGNRRKLAEQPEMA